MMENCWHCSQPHLVPENTIGRCQNCRVDIDRVIYEPQPEGVDIDEINTELNSETNYQTEEEAMSVDYGALKQKVETVLPSKYEFLPKVGGEAEYEIVKIYEDNNSKFNIKVDEERKLEDGAIAKVKKDLGFYLAAQLKNGKILVVNSYSGYQLFLLHKVNDNQKIIVRHAAKGDWKLELK